MSLDILATTSIISSHFGGCFDKSQYNLLEKDEKTFCCTVKGCRREFTSKRNLVDHTRGHHQGSKPHTCNHPGCGKSFLRPAHLIIHNRIHTGEKPFVCEYPGCGKRWNQKSALKQHLRSHTGEKPFACSFQECGKKFSTSSSCKRHILTHNKTDELPINHKRSSIDVWDEPPILKKFPACGIDTSGKETPTPLPELKMNVNFILN